MPRARVLAALLIVSFILYYNVNKILGLLTMSFSLASLFPLLLLFTYERLYGVPLPSRTRGGLALVEDLGRRKKITVFLKVVDVRHGFFDLSPIQLYGRARYLLDGSMLDPESELYIIYTNLPRGALNAYIALGITIENFEDARKKIKQIILTLKKHLVGCGVICSYAKPYEISVGKFFEKTKTSYNLVILTTIGLVILMLSSSSLVVRVICAYGTVLLTSCLILKRSLGPSFKVKGVTLTLVSNEALYSNPSTLDLLQRSRWINSILYRLNEDFLLVIKVKIAPPHVSDLLERESYRAYELGTALDKLSIVSRASRLYTIVERRFRRRESLYEVNVVALCKSKDDAFKLSRSLGAIGLKLRKPLLLTPVLAVIPL